MTKNTRTTIIVGLVIIVLVLLGIARRQRLGQSVSPSPEPIHSAEALGPGDYENTLASGGINRSYKLHVPSSYTSGKAMPLVLYIHGGGGSSDGAKNDGLYPYADKYGFIVVAPAGTGILKEKLLTWNAGTWTTPEGEDSCCSYAFDHQIDDVSFLSNVIQDVKSKFTIDSNRVYATGISNGGIMSFRLGCELPETFAAIAPVAAPAVPQECSKPSEHLVPAMYIHGTADPCAPYNGGAGGACIGKNTLVTRSAATNVDDWRKLVRNISSSEQAYQQGKTNCVLYPGGSGADVEFCTITDGGHTWPSGNQYLPVSKVGPVSYDLSFDQIWAFFKDHPKQ